MFTVKSCNFPPVLTLWCLIEGGWNSPGAWKSPQDLISQRVGIDGGVGKFPSI